MSDSRRSLVVTTAEGQACKSVRDMKVRLFKFYPVEQVKSAGIAIEQSLCRSRCDLIGKKIDF